MKNRVLFLGVIFMMLSCNTKNKKPISLKNSKRDLFKKTIVKSQEFEINTEKDTLVVGNKGTKIVIPKKAFLDSKGNVINQKIKLELSEAISLSDMIMSNLTTTAEGKLLETDGMIFINATYKGENLKINTETPLYIEIPTKNKKSKMKVYEGVRDTLGNMNWKNPKNLKKYLIPIDLELLDFLPEGFEMEAAKYLAYYKNRVNKKTIDSLYYNLPESKCSKTIKENIGGGMILHRNTGVKPESIKTIKDKKFNNTLIATREFEERLKDIHKICSDETLDFYINNLNKNMWENDSLVVHQLDWVNEPVIQTRTVLESINRDQLLIDREVRVVDTIGYKYSLLRNKFKEFQNQKLTNVAHKSIYIKELQEYYTKKLKENIKRADSLREVSIGKEQKNKELKAYRKILKEREKIRMQSYGFTQTKMGWINIDRGTIPKKWNYQQIEVEILNEKEYKQIHVYVVYKTIKSIVKLKTIDNKIFKIGGTTGNKLPIDKKTKIRIVVVAYNKEKSFFETKEIHTKTENNSINNIQVALKEIALKAINIELNKFDDYDENNNIKKDLELTQKIEKEEELNKELLKKAYPCCNIEQNI